MSPRKYEMRQRAAAVEETRRRIIAATKQLHQANGIAATRWDDIARAAGVGVGTVYRHFPTLDELVPACSAHVLDLLALPDADEIRGLFAGVDRPEQRLERLVDTLGAPYERGAATIQRTRAEPDVHPVVREGGDHIDGTVATLIDTALEGFEATDEDRRVIGALLGLRTWEALQAAGLDAAAARHALVGLVAGRLRTH